jgi:hypothetical protein
MSDGAPSLGPCCICETYVGVTVILMLPRRGPIPGHGWGCAVCGLPSDGATAVLCEGCYEFVEAGATPIFVCRGYPGSEGRMLYSALSDEHFDHRAALHREDEEGR